MKNVLFPMFALSAMALSAEDGTGVEAVTMVGDAPPEVTVVSDEAPVPAAKTKAELAAEKKAAKEADKVEKARLKAETAAAKAAEKPEPVTRAKQPEANGVVRPTPGTKTGRVWEIADAISADAKRPALREEVMETAKNEGINPGTIATQYARWTAFYGVTKEVRKGARDALKPAPVAATAPVETAPATE